MERVSDDVTRKIIRLDFKFLEAQKTTKNRVRARLCRNILNVCKQDDLYVNKLKGFIVFFFKFWDFMRKPEPRIKQINKNTPSSMLFPL